ncbi:nucleotidyltransferase domain-containing protein [Evansella halocellulosilytica]|uniref:nucleotidyltransferase domain-containing protein n=1 Tax=Evansella halocellulosilytica TaxID=2011013 RepID=UPI000BB9A913|nr:nucleotidyltransferase family protein [Evansella halocellulosilytica]
MDNLAFKLRLSNELNLILEMIEKDVHEINVDTEKFRQLDWNFFIKLSLHHRLYPMLYPKLKRLSERGVPPSVVKKLYIHYQKNTFQMLQLRKEMEIVNNLFTENNIRLLFLKGPHLAQQLYGDYSLRTSNDLDLIVNIENLKEAERLLDQLGYVKDDYIRTILSDWKWRHHHVTYYHPQKGTKIEIHWRMHPGPGKEASFQELWERKKECTDTLYSLGNEDLFVFLILHGARHGWSRLRWLVDIQKLFKINVDIAKAVRIMKRYRSEHMCGQAVILLSSLLNTHIPEGIHSLRMTKKAKNLAEGAIFYIERMVNLHTTPVPEEVSTYHKRYLFTLMPISQKLLFLLSFLYPYPEDAETLPLPKTLHFLYFPLRPVLWVWRKTRKQAFT